METTALCQYTASERQGWCCWHELWQVHLENETHVFFVCFACAKQKGHLFDLLPRAMRAAMTGMCDEDKMSCLFGSSAPWV